MWLAKLVSVCLVVFANGMSPIPDMCRGKTCPSMPRHYEEFGCTAIAAPGECCPHRFDCSSLKTRDPTKCYYNGKSYNIGDHLDSPEVSSTCTASCLCRNSFENPAISEFLCAHIDCAEFFGRPRAQPDVKCIRQYAALGCCMEREVCGEALNSLAKCQFEGKEYHEGERMYKSPYKCICQQGFEDKPVEDNKDCRKIHCNMELHYTARMVKGCIPIYFHTDNSCPIGWRCPNDTTRVIPHASRQIDDPSMQCSFGNLKMNLGDTLSPENEHEKCTTCTCNVLPHPHCLKTC